MNIRSVSVVGSLCLFLLAAVPLVAAVEIWEIQGPGMVSPMVGQRVTTRDNIIFAVGADGFFMQTPDERSDGDPQTSDGIFVLYGSTSAVDVGDRVDVTATVAEYHGLTELTGSPAVSVVETDQLLASAIFFNRNLPRPDQPWDETTIERFEGMRIAVDAGIVSSATDSYGDAWVTASGVDRLRREPGILWPGINGLGVWDGNPEAFEIKSDGLGLPEVELLAGSTFSAEGAMTYSWGDYQLWPTRFELSSWPQFPRAVPQTHASAIRIATQNVERLGPGLSNDYEVELAKDALQIVEVLGVPDVVAVQEVRDLGTLEDLAEAITGLRPEILYEALLIEGNGYGGIEVGFLVRPTVAVQAVNQIGGDVEFDWDGSRLFDRPPLVLEIQLEPTDLDLTVITVHLRSLNGIEDPYDGPRVRAKRDAQARWMADWVQSRQQQRPNEPLLVVGDFNAFEFSDGYVDVIGQITGTPDPQGALFPAYIAVDPALVNAVTLMAAKERYTYVYQGNAEVLDHILLNQAALPFVVKAAAARGNADVSRAHADDQNTALRSSDHDGMVVTFNPTSARNPGDGGRSSGQ